MARPKNLSTLEHTTIRGIGDPQGQASAKLVVDAIGIGSMVPLAGLAGLNATGAALDISSLTEGGARLVRVEVAGDVNIRFQTAIGTVVTATLWHAGIQSGQGRSFLISQDVKWISAWGVAGAWSFVIYPQDEVR